MYSGEISTKMKNRIRNFICYCFIILLTPCWLAVYCKLVSMATLSQFFSLFPGCLGTWFRRAYHVMVLESCAMDVGIEFGTFFSKTAVVLEEKVYIGARCIVGSCHIGSGTLLGSNIGILSGRHQHGIEGSKTDGGIYQKILIGKNVWIGNGSIIMNKIGDNVVVGAGSVVVHEIPDNVIAVGNPAIVKKQIPSKN